MFSVPVRCPQFSLSTQSVDHCKFAARDSFVNNADSDFFRIHVSTLSRSMCFARVVQHGLGVDYCLDQQSEDTDC